MKMIIPFGPWLPDRPGFKNPGLLTADNVIPLENGYAPRRGAEVHSGTTLSTRALGMAIATAQSGTVYYHYGIAAKLYDANGFGSITDRSKVGGYSTASGDVWEFVSFDRNYTIIATNYTDAIQSKTTGAAASFADMITSTNKPTAKHVAIIGQFVVLGFTNDATDGVRRSRIWWSAFGDQTDFDPDAATQCDYEDLASGGDIQKIIGGAEYGIIVQHDMVRTMRYIGGSAVFEFQPLNFVPGTRLPNSVIGYAGKVFYFSTAGFAMLDGGAVTYIGAGKIDHNYWDEASRSPGTTGWGVSAAIEPVNKLVCWALPGANVSAAAPDDLYMFNWGNGNWAHWPITGEFEFIGSGIRSSGDFCMLAFNTSHVLSVYPSANDVKSATFVTADLQPDPGRRWQVNSVRPILNMGPLVTTPEINIASSPRQRLIDAVTYSTPAAMNAEGLCSFRTAGMYQRLRVSISATWSVYTHTPKFQGLEIDYELDGER